MKKIDLTGQNFGLLYVIDKAPHRYTPCGHKLTLWNCKCECGKIIQVCTHDLRSGHTTKCRKCAMIKANGKHGMSYTRLYNIWREMKRRCFTKTNCNYPRYGGRGITMCDEWANDFMPFYNWAIANGYDETAERGECSIDRINVNGNYEPSNCRWVNFDLQQNNRRTNVFLEYRGEKHTMKEWSKILNIPYYVIQSRIYHNWSVEDALTKPIIWKKYRPQ